MRFEETVRGSGARAGLVWRSAAGKTAFRLISQDLKKCDKLKTERLGLLAARKEKTLFARRVAEGY